MTRTLIDPAILVQYFPVTWDPSLSAIFTVKTFDFFPILLSQGRDDINHRVIPIFPIWQSLVDIFNYRILLGV